MNRLQYLLVTTLSLTLSGFALAANADSFSPSQCTPFVNTNETQILQQSVSQKTVDLADQCVQNNACSQLYSDPNSISVCAKKLNTADYLVNFLFTRNYLDENQVIGHFNGFLNWMHSGNSTQASNPASNAPKASANDATSSSNEAITPVNVNDDSSSKSNNNNSKNNDIHWF